MIEFTSAYEGAPFYSFRILNSTGQFVDLAEGYGVAAERVVEAVAAVGRDEDIGAFGIEVAEGVEVARSGRGARPFAFDGGDRAVLPGQNEILHWDV